MATIDGFAHLRDNQQTYRRHTASSHEIAWCRSCQVHHADRPGGLCPVCTPDRSTGHAA